MELDPTTSAILALIGGALSAGGLASKFIDWLGKRTASKTTIDAKTIDADLTVNERLLERIATLETRIDETHDEHAVDLRARDARIAEVVSERDRLAKREVELLTQVGNLARDNETLRADLVELRKHAERLESENRKMRDASQRMRRPT